LIVLDTNVLSALMLDRPDRDAVAWVDGRRADELWTTTVNVFEVEQGILRLDPGRKRERLAETLRAVLARGLGRRLASFDEPAALAAAQLEARRRRDGRIVGLADTMIAGIVMARGAAIATRNVKDFADCGVPVHDPWAA
jgi:predicted nucleic acid-binding protein